MERRNSQKTSSIELGKMYYNIKIKSQQSEFILESNDKNVTQREMDIYFAHIFNASEEFKSKIKKVEIVNENLKSIEDFERLSETKNLKQETPAQKDNLEFKKGEEQTSIQIEETPIENKEEVVQNTVEQTPIQVEETPIEDKEEVVQNTVEQTPIQVEETPIENKEELELNYRETEHKNTIQENLQQAFGETAQVIGLEENSPEISIKDITSQKTEIEEIIKLAQAEIDSIDLSNKKNLIQTKSVESDEIEKNSDGIEIIKFASKKELSPEIKIEPLGGKRDYSAKNQEILDNIFANEEQKIETKDKENKNIENFENLKITENSEKINSSPITESQNEILIASNHNNNEIPRNISNDSIKIENEKISLEEIQINLDNNENKTNEEKKELEEPQQINIQKGPVLDFNLFLKGFIADEIIDEFLICAYYIKNILHEENFTMKFLNSKLFPATGKIADMSVTESLIEKGLIKKIDTPESIKYSINSEGEEYFVSKFQNRT